jgi:hypothetical protein
MKPSMADTARAYLLPAVATVCSAQVAMLLTMLLLEVPERAFQGPTFRCGVALAVVVSIVSLRRRAGRAFAMAKRNGEVKLRSTSAADERSAESQGQRSTHSVDRYALRSADVGLTPAPREPVSYIGVAASCKERTLVVLYLQFRRLPFAIESRERGYANAAGQHA